MFSFFFWTRDARWPAELRIMEERASWLLPLPGRDDDGVSRLRREDWVFEVEEGVPKDLRAAAGEVEDMEDVCCLAWGRRKRQRSPEWAGIRGGMIAVGDKR